MTKASEVAIGLKSLAVAAGAATSEPAGAIAWSSVLNDIVKSTGAVWWSVFPRQQTVEINLGATGRRSGTFTITSNTAMTVGDPVAVTQAVGPYTAKGFSADEAQMDNVVVRASVTAANTITCYWNSRSRVRGNIKFNFIAAGYSPYVPPPTSANFTYAQIGKNWAGERDLTSDVNRHYGQAGSSAWIATVTGTELIFSGIGGNTWASGAPTIQWSVDGGAVTSSAPVSGDYTVFTGLPDVAHKVVIQIGDYQGPFIYQNRSGTIAKVTGGAPLIEVVGAMTVQSDGQANVVYAGPLIANSKPTFTPTMLPDKFIPVTMARGSFTRIVVTTNSAGFVSLHDGSAVTHYPISNRSVIIDNLSGNKQYALWNGGQGEKDFSVGFVGGALQAPTFTRLMVQVGTSITEGATSSSIRNYSDIFRTAIGLSYVPQNWGIGGSTVNFQKVRIDGYLAAIPTPPSGSVAIIELGRNDGTMSGTQSDYTYIISAFRTKGFYTVLCRGLLPENGTPATTQNAVIQQIVTDYVAANPGARVRYINTDAWSGISTSDSVHPNQAGYNQITTYSLADYPALLA